MTDFIVPNAAAFRDALARLAGSIPENYLKMLQAHYAAPARTITATELARAVGYKTYSGANLHYGKLAALLASELSWSSEDFLMLKLIVDFVLPGEADNEEILWVMRPELADALTSLGWVHRVDEGA
jgi:hypothetical protein